MADPATQFSPATLQYNTYTPVKGGDLGGSHLFGGAGELWAKVGQTALDAAGRINQTAGMMMQSPMNPAVKAQQDEAVARADLGRAAMAYVKANPQWMHGVVGETPQGATMTAPITQPVAQQAAEGIDYSGSGEEHPKEKEQPKEEPKKKAPEPPANLNEGMSQVSYPGNLYASSAPGIPAGYQGGGSSTAAQEGTPASMTFRNPATGNIEPLQTGPPPSQAQPPASSIWSPQRPAPMAPPAPGAPPAQPPAQSQTPAAVTQADQAAMQQWQQQNAHPVMTSQEALGWMKNQTTLAQDATYLPMGGPGGAPAFAFHMKGGGMNLVPVSQMIQKGAGPLVAAQSTSQVISATDRAQQPPEAMPSGIGMGAPQGQPAMGPQAPPPDQPQIAQAPPAAPTGPMPSGTGLASAQGAPAPAAPGAYNAAAYQMPQGPTLTQTGAVNPALMAGEDNQQALAASRAQQEDAAAKAAAVHISGVEPAMEADARSPNKRLFDWHTDPADPNHPFAEFPDPHHPFWKRRYYMGIGMDAGPYTAENMQKQQLFEALAGPTGVPLPKDENGKPPVIDEKTIADSSPEWRNHWLNYIRDFTLHKDAPLPTSPEGVNLSNAANAVQAAQRIRDKILWMKQNNIPMDVISQAELVRSKEAGWSAASTTNPAEAALWYTLARGGSKNNFADELGQDYKNLNTYLARTQGGTYPEAATPKAEEWGIPVTWPITADFSVPRTTNVSTIEALNKIGSGDTPDEALAHINEVLGSAVNDYKNANAKLGPAGLRTPDVDQKNLSDLMDAKKGYIEDKNNKMWDEKHEKLVNRYGPIPHLKTDWLQQQWGTVGAQLTSWDTKELDKLGVGKGDPFIGPDGKPYTRTK